MKQVFEECACVHHIIFLRSRTGNSKPVFPTGSMVTDVSKVDIIWSMFSTLHLAVCTLVNFMSLVVKLTNLMLKIRPVITL
jgi:hypothetical protein